MKTAVIVLKIILILSGVVVMLGTVGQSDFESIIIKKEITPFWHLVMMAVMGLALALAGIFFPLPKGGDHKWKIYSGNRKG